MAGVAAVVAVTQAGRAPLPDLQATCRKLWNIEAAPVAVAE